MGKMRHTSQPVVYKAAPQHIQHAGSSVEKKERGKKATLSLEIDVGLFPAVVSINHEFQ